MARRKNRQRGASSAEFVIVVIPFMMMLTTVLQLSLASFAKVLVSYSAFTAARAAIVVVPQAPEENSSSANAEKANQIGNGGNSKGDYDSSAKAAAIKNAAAYALIASSPSLGTIASGASVSGVVGSVIPNTNISTGWNGTLGKAVDDTLNGQLAAYKPALGNYGLGGSGETVRGALDGGLAGQGSLARSLSKLVYAKLATGISLVDRQGKVKSKFAWNEPITARVTYIFSCQIPLANRFICKRFNDLPQKDRDAVSVDFMPGWFLAFSAEHTLTNQGLPQ